MSGGIFRSHNLGDGGLYGLLKSHGKVRNAAKHLTMYRTAPTIKNDTANSAMSIVPRLRNPELVPDPDHPHPIIA